MGNGLEEDEEAAKEAEKLLHGWGLFGSNRQKAVDLYSKAANSLKRDKSWDKAGSKYRELASCHLKIAREAQKESKHDAAQAFVDAANCYKNTNISESVSCLIHAVILFFEIGRDLMAAKCLKEIAELYESEQNIEQAFLYYEKCADCFQDEEVTTAANQIKEKVARYAAELEQYQRSTEIYEEMACQSLNSNSLMYASVFMTNCYPVRGYLLKAGICQLCKGDFIAITNALERYQEMDPTFSGTREYTFLADIAAAIEEGDVGKFTDTVSKFDSITPLDSWKTTLLSRVKEKLKAKELEEDDLT